MKQTMELGEFLSKASQVRKKKKENPTHPTLVVLSWMAVPPMGAQGTERALLLPAGPGTEGGRQVGGTAGLHSRACATFRSFSTLHR